MKQCQALKGPLFKMKTDIADKIATAPLLSEYSVWEKVLIDILTSTNDSIFRVFENLKTNVNL